VSGEVHPIDNRAGRPSDISRAHQIRMPQPGWIDVAGGKLTTYRLMAEQTVDRAVDFADFGGGPCITADMPLLPGEPHPLYSGVLPPEVTREAIEHSCRREWALHLRDVMIRRTSWRYYYSHHGAIARQATEWMAPLLGWDSDRRERELLAYQRECETMPADAAAPDPHIDAGLRARSTQLESSIMRHITSLLLIAILTTCGLARAAVRQPRGYDDAIRQDLPSLHLRFGDSSPGAAARRLGNASVVSGIKATSEGVSLVDEYTIEWWQLTPQDSAPAPIIRIGAKEFGVLPVPQSASAKHPAASKSTFAAGGDNGQKPIRSHALAFAGKWYHVAVVGRRGGQTQFYVNGQPDGEPIARAIKLTGEITLGAELSGPAISGEVAVYDHALSAGRIRDHFQAALDALPQRKIVTVGHRGFNRFAPENTRVSYQQAVALGVPIVEMDLHLTRDNHIVLMHDDTVKRTTGKPGKVSDYTVDEITKLDAGSWKDKSYAGEPVPRIEQIGQVCRNRAIMMLDLKATGQGQQIADWLSSTNYPTSGIIVAPWTDEEGVAVHRHLPDVTMIRLTSKVPTDQFDDAYFSRMKQIGFSAFSVNWVNLTQAFIDAAHGHGMKVYAWTINDAPDVAGCVFAGVDGIITDDPPTTMKRVAELTGR
jgi:glycerophosphoryl diester phosphodiesterase